MYGQTFNMFEKSAVMFFAILFWKKYCQYRGDTCKIIANSIAIQKVLQY